MTTTINKLNEIIEQHKQDVLRNLNDFTTDTTFKNNTNLALETLIDNSDITLIQRQLRICRRSYINQYNGGEYRYDNLVITPLNNLIDALNDRNKLRNRKIINTVPYI